MGLNAIPAHGKSGTLGMKRKNGEADDNIR